MSSQPEKTNYAVEAGMLLVKAVNLAYDLVTLPIYTIAQRPWDHWRNSNLVYARRTVAEDPRSPYVRECARNEGSLEGIETMDQLTRTAIRQFPDKPCFGTRQVLGEDQEKQPNGKVFTKLILGDYEWLTYREMDEKLDLIGRGLMSLGVRPRQNVVIFAETRQEWMLSAQACLRINIPIVTLYATLGDDGVIHGINETEATHLITSQELLPKVSKILPKIPSLTHVIYMESPVRSAPVETLSEVVRTIPFKQLETIGKNADSGLQGETPGPEDTAIIMYTSGSTGIPKGVMISQSNIVATAKGFATICPQVDTTDSYIAYLPLAHVLELAAESLSLALGAKIGYSSPTTLTDKSTGIKAGCKGDATLLKPTIMVSVPLILDRVRKAITEGAESKSAVSRALFRYAVNYKAFWLRRGYRTPLMDKLVFDKVRALLGGCIKVIATGSAPLSCDTHEFIRCCLGCDVVQGYGLTETAAGSTIMELSDTSFGRVGAPLVGCYVRLVDWDEAGYHATDKPHPRGEIVVGGSCVTKGYYKNEALTREMFREEGGVRWFYTGDIGEMFPDGTIKIIDRKKDLVKLSYGEYISLGKVETELKTCPLIDNICVYGNSFHTYLIALVAPNPKALAGLASSIGKPNMSFHDMCKDPQVVQAATEALLSHAKKCGTLNKMEIPHKVKLCAEEWQPDSGLVTAAFKIRRKVVQEFYQAEIDDMYSNASSMST